MDPAQAADLTNGFKAKGARNPLLAIYGPAGTSDAVFYFQAAHLSGGTDFVQGTRMQAAALEQLYPNDPGAFTLSTPSESGVIFTCLTITAAITGATEEVSCVWQGGHEMVLGVGSNLSADETVALTSQARLALQLG